MCIRRGMVSLVCVCKSMVIILLIIRHSIIEVRHNLAKTCCIWNVWGWWCKNVSWRINSDDKTADGRCCLWDWCHFSLSDELLPFDNDALSYRRRLDKDMMMLGSSSPVWNVMYCMLQCESIIKIHGTARHPLWQLAYAKIRRKLMKTSVSFDCGLLQHIFHSA